MPVSPGSKFGPYEVLSSLGAGGMGEVYKARDHRLERTVAVKVSKEKFGERLQISVNGGVEGMWRGDGRITPSLY